MEEFFQNLRKIQKKERKNRSLARVEETFYEDIYSYMEELKKEASKNLFSRESSLLKDTQRIATEICERREYKITEAAVVNIHRSFHLFSGKPKFDLVDTTPLNLTEEEERLYFSLLDTLKKHRFNISLDDLDGKSQDIKEVTVNEEKPKEKKKVKKEHSTFKPIKKPKNQSKTKSADSIINKIDEIANAKIITDEKYEPIEKQILQSMNENIGESYNNINNEKNYQKDIDSLNKNKFNELSTVLISDNINPIIGVDEKIYGPFRPEDVVVMPSINAKVFIRNRKARFIKI